MTPVYISSADDDDDWLQVGYTSGVNTVSNTTFTVSNNTLSTRINANGNFNMSSAVPGTSPEFASEPELVLGALRGYRAWLADIKTGQLYPVSFAANYEWHEGENIATCFSQSSIAKIVEIDASIDDVKGWVTENHPGWVFSTWHKPLRSSVKTVRMLQTKCDSADVVASCPHGFYAFNTKEIADGQYRDYGCHPAGKRIVTNTISSMRTRELVVIYGAIDAYGMITEGTRGFRATKAQIVYLVIPDPVLAALVRSRFPSATVHATWPSDAAS